MMLYRPSEERGHASWGWLDTHHTFSFANYYDPAHMGFRALRVINEDRVAPGAGFPTHPHRDMEIVTYVLSGAIEHRDSMGNGSVIFPGDVQRMSAGTGVTHSEFNHSKTDPLHFLQIWIVPNTRGLEPSYEQRSFDTNERRGRLRVVAAPDGRDGAVTLAQDALIYSSLLEAGQTVNHDLAPQRHAWIQLIDGDLTVAGQLMHAGDGLALVDQADISIEASRDSHLLLFDLE